MELRDKIAGALYGMALGDAMGMPAELWGRERARKFFGGKSIVRRSIGRLINSSRPEAI